MARASFRKLLGLALLCIALPASAQSRVSPESVGLDGERLQRIDAFMERSIAAGSIAGGVTLVARHGKIAHLEAHGLMDIDSNAPMQTDALFRLASMSKPVAALAVMMLVEEGKVRLTDPVSRYLPSFANQVVAVPKGRTPQDGYDTVPVNRPITIKDLLTHSSGFLSGPYSNSQGFAAMAQQQQLGLAYVDELGAAPLEFQPGSNWAYSAVGGFDVLSRIVELASGVDFNTFLTERVFKPLGIEEDITFWPNVEQRQRLATLYGGGPNGLAPRPNPDSMSGEHYFSGAGGLMGSAEAYAKIAMALSMDGSLGRTRLLGKRAVEVLRSPLLDHEFMPDTPVLIKPGEAFGLGVKVVEDATLTNSLLANGSFGWIGLYGCYVLISPEHELVGLMLVQTFTPGMIEDFETAVMQALVE